MNFERLKRLAKESKNYESFEIEAIKWLRWYKIPKDWTRKTLKDFYLREIYL